MLATRAALLAVLLGPVVTNDCGVDEVKTCQMICTMKLNRPVYHVEPLGKTGTDRWRTCACYPARVVVVDDLPAPAEKDDQKRR